MGVVVGVDVGEKKYRSTEVPEYRSKRQRLGRGAWSFLLFGFSFVTSSRRYSGTPVLRYSGTPVLRYFGTSVLVRSTLPARKHVEEINHVLVFGEDAVVVEVDVVAGCAFRAGEDVEEIDHVLVFGEDIVVVEIDVVA